MKSMENEFIIKIKKDSCYPDSQKIAQILASHYCIHSPELAKIYNVVPDIEVKKIK